MPAHLRILSALALGVGLGCSAATPTETLVPCDALTRAADPGRAPVVLIVNDTMRADRVGAYGGPARTPVFDRFAAENLLFLRAYTQAPWTRPSIATLFTSLYPSQHGWRSEEMATRALPESLTTLAETFRTAGYHTAAFISNPWLLQRLGMSQGFDVYDDSFAESPADGAILSTAALAWIAAVPEGDPFFLYLHYMDSHRPYPALHFDELRARSEALAADDREISHVTRLEIAALVRIEGEDPLAAALVRRSLALIELAYDKGVERFDAALGIFLTGLEASWAGDRAAVLITSDHGEALYDRGYGNHGQGLHDDEVAVPLAARLPGIAPTRGQIECVVGLIDVMPTLCAYLGLPCPEPVFGQSWLSGPGTPESRFMVTEGVGGQPRHRAIRGQRYKLLWQPGTAPEGQRAHAHSLYDMTEDPGETRDLVDSQDPELQQILASLAAALREAVPAIEIEPGAPVTIDDELRAQLRELGYAE